MWYSSLTFIYYCCLFVAWSFIFFCKTFITSSMKSLQGERFCVASIFRIRYCHPIINIYIFILLHKCKLPWKEIGNGTLIIYYFGVWVKVSRCGTPHTYSVSSKYFWKEDLTNILEKIKFKFVSRARTNPISQAYSVNKFLFHHIRRKCSSSLVCSQSEIPSHLSMLYVHFPPPLIITQRQTFEYNFLNEKEWAQ